MANEKYRKTFFQKHIATAQKGDARCISRSPVRPPAIRDLGFQPALKFRNPNYSPNRMFEHTGTKDALNTQQRNAVSISES